MLKVTASVLILAVCGQALQFGQKQIDFGEDGTITITTPMGKVVSIKRPIYGNGNMEIVVKGPNMPSKVIQVNDIHQDTTQGWPEGESIRVRRSKSEYTNPQYSVLKNILIDYQGVSETKAFQKLLKKVEKSVQKGELNSSVLKVLNDLNTEPSTTSTVEEIVQIPGFSAEQILNTPLVDQQILAQYGQQLMQQYQMQGHLPKYQINEILIGLYRQSKFIAYLQPFSSQLLQQLIQQEGAENVVYSSGYKMQWYQLMNTQYRLYKNQILLELIETIIQQQPLVKELLKMMYMQAEINNQVQLGRFILEVMDKSTVELVDVQLMQYMNAQKILNAKQILLKLLQELFVEYRQDYQILIQEVLQMLLENAQMLRQPLMLQTVQQLIRGVQTGVQTNWQRHVQILMYLNGLVKLQNRQNLEIKLQKVQSMYASYSQTLNQLLQNIYDQNALGVWILKDKLSVWKKEVGQIAISPVQPWMQQYPLVQPDMAAVPVNPGWMKKMFWKSIPPNQMWAVKSQLYGPQQQEETMWPQYVY